MTTIRPATVEDAPFLAEMLAAAADWRPGARRRSIDEIMRVPELAHYLTDWPQSDDVGFVAEEGAPVGVAWWRLFPEHDRGYGFVDAATPELSIGVAVAARRRGIGGRLLQSLIGEARRRALPGLSLSVERDNPAASLYERLGFETVGHVGGSLTMALPLRPHLR